MKAELGEPLPLGDKHGVSVYFPTWRDTLGYARQEPELLAQLKTGYPRFFVPRVNRNLADRLIAWVSSNQLSSNGHDEAQLSLLTEPGRLALLFPTAELAMACKTYLETENKVPVLAFQMTFSGEYRIISKTMSSKPPQQCLPGKLYMVVYPQQLFKNGKAFWQHTGFGISSRWAEFWLENAPFLNNDTSNCECISRLPIKKAEDANQIIRSRIGSLLSSPQHEICKESVHLYPTGMSAISHSATALRERKGLERACRVVVFGFLYVDTFKVLSKIYQFESELYGYVTPSDLDVLAADLAGGLQIDALYTEFPGNPLLATVDLKRLYDLSKQYGFMLIVDDTVGTSVNVNILPFCDVICTSLTKMFSGGCNVMGGSMVLNPRSPYYKAMQQTLENQFVNTYFPLDVLMMESNSADFDSRVITASRNAEHIAQRLRHHPAVAKVFYPKGNETQEIYDLYRRPDRGYGYLLSIRFVHDAAAIAFHDALDVAKGPSLGTNFTLCCAYTLFGHYNELEWAAKYGVVEHLVRISVGIEKEEELDDVVQRALDAAGEAHKLEEGGTERLM